MVHTIFPSEDFSSRLKDRSGGLRGETLKAAGHEIAGKSETPCPRSSVDRAVASGATGRTFNPCRGRMAWFVFILSP